MSSWLLKSVYQYWDYRVNAIDRLSRTLEAMPQAEQQGQLGEIHRAVRMHVDALPDEALIQAVFVVADDLYKAASHASYWDWALENYLLASAGTFFQAVSERGYIVNYVVDNTYADLTGPALLFPLWYGQTGLQYICPQYIAYWLTAPPHEREEVPQPLDPERVKRVSTRMTDACSVAKELVERCRREAHHFIFLTADSEQADFSAAMNGIESPGLIHIFRNQPPEPGTKCSIRMPSGRCQ
jgi:hypothetical protein